MEEGDILNIKVGRLRCLLTYSDYEAVLLPGLLVFPFIYLRCVWTGTIVLSRTAYFLHI